MPGEDILEGFHRSKLAALTDQQSLRRHVWEVLRAAEGGKLDPGPFIERSDSELDAMPPRVLFVKITELDGVEATFLEQDRIPEAVASLIDGVHGEMSVDGTDIGSLDDAIALMKLQAMGSVLSAAEYVAQWKAELAQWGDAPRWPTAADLAPMMGLFEPAGSEGFDGRVDQVVCYVAG